MHWKSLIGLILVIALFEITSTHAKGGFRGGGSRGGSRGSSWSRGGSSSKSSSSWFSRSKPSPPSAPAAPAPKPSYGWQANTNTAPKNTNYGWTRPSNPAPAPSSGFSNVGHVAKPAPAITPPQTNPKPAYGFSSPSQNVQATNPKTSYGFTNPNTKPAVASNQPSSNIGSGGYPVQGGVQRNPPPYSPVNTHGTSIAQGRVPPPSYSPTNPHINPPSYSSHYPKKQIINNHYHYNGPPPAYSQPSHFGMSSAYYPQQSSFGYPGGYFSNSNSMYNGMRMFSSGPSSYGYPGSGSWGVPSYGYGSSGIGSTTKGLLIGAAGGYLASSLINRISNPWGYSGYGYGHGYMDRYRYVGNYDQNRPTPAPIIIDPTKDWINCVSYDPVSKVTMINPNCSCTVTVTTDPVSGQNTSHHDCTPYAKMTATPVQPALTAATAYGVNNPPPSFNGGLYGSDVAYGGGYGTNYSTTYIPPATVSTPTEVTPSALNTDPEAEARRREIFAQLEKLLNMGSFSSNATKSQLV